MAVKDIDTLFSEVRQHLRSHRLGCVIDTLLETATKHRLTTYIARLQRLAEDYSYMFAYMTTHGDDPGREQFVAATCRELALTADLMRRDLEADADTDIYYAQVRMNRLGHRSAQMLLDRYTSLAARLDSSSAGDANHNVLRRQTEQALDDIFNYVWVAFPLSGEEQKLLTASVSDQHSPMALRAQIISALMLGAIRQYDTARIATLMDIYDSLEDPALQARTLVALMLAIYGRDERMNDEKALRARWQLWMDDDSLRRRLALVVTDIVRANDTERVNRELRDDFIPAMQKMKPDIDRLMKQDRPEEDSELNPQWEELLQNSDISDRMRRLTEMQQEGADMMMLPFSSLKSFPFFRDVSSWFLPFDIDHSALAAVRDNIPRSMLDILDMGGMMCDSDKYSLALSMSHIPVAQRDMLAGQLDAQRETMREAMDEAMLLASSADNIFKSESLRFIRDIYRFQHLFREKSQFGALLPNPFLLQQIPFAGTRMALDADTAEPLADFYMRHKYYTEAAETLLCLESHSPSEGSDRPERLAFCLQHSGRMKEALRYYRVAELFDGDSSWLLRHLAAVCHALQMWPDAIAYYERALEHDADNANLLMRYASALTAAGKYDRALKIYYKVSYLHPANLDAQRAVAWTELLAGNADKSCQLYETVLSHPDATPEDWVNAAHAHMARAHYGEALKLYTSSGMPRRQMLDTLTTDTDVIIKAGGNLLDIDLMADRLENEK